MSDESCVAIEIAKEIPFFGAGDTLESRLRKVSLRGFPDVKIYENGTFEFVFLTPEQIQSELHTPQLRVYREHLNRIANLNKLFSEQGINILNLQNAYDFIATSESGQETEWTILPPVVERFNIPKSKNGKLNYANLIGEELIKSLNQKGLTISPEVSEIDHTSDSGIFDLINDGSHRIHYGFENGGIKILRISGITNGFPYYAAPQKYNMAVFNTREEALNKPETKIHIVESPGHKDLYRLFPSGGIMSGNIRYDKRLMS